MTRAVVNCLWLDDATDSFGWTTGTNESTTGVYRNMMREPGALVVISGINV